MATLSRLGPTHGESLFWSDRLPHFKLPSLYTPVWGAPLMWHCPEPRAEEAQAVVQRLESEGSAVGPVQRAAIQDAVNKKSPLGTGGYPSTHRGIAVDHSR